MRRTFPLSIVATRLRKQSNGRTFSYRHEPSSAIYVNISGTQITRRRRFQFMVNFRNIRTLGTTLALCALAAGSVFAQAPKEDPGQNAAPAAGRRAQGGQGQRGGGRVSLATLPIKALDATVKLTDDEKSKITAIQEKYKTDAQALRPAQGAQPDPANRQKMRDLSTKANTDIEAVLTKEQNEKLKATLK